MAAQALPTSSRAFLSEAAAKTVTGALACAANRTGPARARTAAARKRRRARWKVTGSLQGEDDVGSLDKGGGALADLQIHFSPLSG